VNTGSGQSSVEQRQWGRRESVRGGKLSGRANPCLHRGQDQCESTVDLIPMVLGDCLEKSGFLFVLSPLRGDRGPLLLAWSYRFVFSLLHIGYTHFCTAAEIRAIEESQRERKTRAGWFTRGQGLEKNQGRLQSGGKSSGKLRSNLVSERSWGGLVGTRRQELVNEAH